MSERFNENFHLADDLPSANLPRDTFAEIAYNRWLAEQSEQDEEE